jgi:hypothetical protein
MGPCRVRIEAVAIDRDVGRSDAEMREAMTQLAADLIVDRLRDWGVTRLFAYAGDGIDPLLGALRRAGGDPEYVGARQRADERYVGE